MLPSSLVSPFVISNPHRLYVAQSGARDTPARRQARTGGHSGRHWICCTLTASNRLRQYASVHKRVLRATHHPILVDARRPDKMETAALLARDEALLIPCAARVRQSIPYFTCIASRRGHSPDRDARSFPHRADCVRKSLLL